jgi:hypothetical protein
LFTTVVFHKGNALLGTTPGCAGLGALQLFSVQVVPVLG